MGKKSRRRKVAPGSARVTRPVIAHVSRPFEGLAAEEALVAMRDIIPAATMRATLTEEYGSREITLVTMLPDAAQALIRADGEILLALQTRSHSGDASHDLGVALSAALARRDAIDAGDASAGAIYVDVRDAGPRFTDMVANFAELTIESDLGFWVAPQAAEDEDVRHAIAESGEELIPTALVPDTGVTVWHRMDRIFVRWVRSEDESSLFTAMARLAVRDELTIGHGSAFIGAFRASGLLIPVFEVPEDVEAEALTDGVKTLNTNLAKALSSTDPVDDDVRRVRAGLVSRQVPIR